MMYLKIKRSFDILFSFIMILLLLPVLFVISVVIKFECPNCVIIFKQKRYGKNSEAFVIYKFRTMKKDAPNISACEMVINQDKYITKFGKFLRKTSLDELPQLFNILKGDMSIIGPRPVILAEEYLQNLRKQNGSDNILPGLTGLAQVNGRNSLSDDEKAEFDAKYYYKICFWLDVKIFLGTLYKVLKHDDIDCINKETKKEGREKVKVG